MQAMLLLEDSACSHAAGEGLGHAGLWSPLRVVGVQVAPHALPGQARCRTELIAGRGIVELYASRRA